MINPKDEIKVGDIYTVTMLVYNTDWLGVPYAIENPNSVLHPSFSYFQQGSVITVEAGPIKGLNGQPFYLVASDKDRGYVNIHHLQELKIQKSQKVPEFVQ